MSERGRNNGRNRGFVNYSKPRYFSAAAAGISQSDELVRTLPFPIGRVIELTQLPRIPENSAFVNSYGADLSVPFLVYLTLRHWKVKQFAAATVAFGGPAAFEGLEFLLRNNHEVMDTYNHRFDPLDFAAYGVATAGAVILDKAMQRRADRKVQGVIEVSTIEPPRSATAPTGTTNEERKLRSTQKRQRQAEKRRRK